MKFGLEQRHLDFVIETLNKYIKRNDVKFYIFGSRAKGTYKEYSDIDIAVKVPDYKLSSNVLGKILTELSDSTLPYEVDVIDLNSVDKKFKDLIEKSLIPIN